MSSGSVAVPPGVKSSPLNFIYACSICCYSFTDVYEGHHGTVQGFSDGINPKERLVTHLYLASCCHVFCSSHLENSGPSFHPEGQQPKAPCPVCIRETSDDAPRDLYSIRGFEKDEHDPAIPSMWFDIPPFKTESNGKEMEALRFQYLALVRYCQHTHATRKPLQDALARAEEKLAAMTTRVSEEHANSVKLQNEIEQQRHEDMQELEQYRQLSVNPRDFAFFKNNKAAITQYLNLIPDLVTQNEKMRERLAYLGFAMPLEPVPNLAKLDLRALEDSVESHPDPSSVSSRRSRKMAIGHSAKEPARISDSPVASMSTRSGRPPKRQRLESPAHLNYQPKSSVDSDHMPPPQKLSSRLSSVRKIVPTLRSKLNGTRSKPATKLPTETLNFYSDQPLSVKAPSGRPLACEEFSDGGAYMSGALSAEPAAQDLAARSSKLLTSIGVNDQNPPFAFRSFSPAFTHEQKENLPPLPQQPSYLNLMDGLCYDNTIQLGLKDPRKNVSPSYISNSNASQDVRAQHKQQIFAGLGGHHHQDTDLSSSPLQSHYVSIPSGAQFHGSELMEFADRPPQNRVADLVYNPVTPAAQKVQQHGHPIENVVSPITRSTCCPSSAFGRTRVAEAKGSSARSDAYRSRKVEANKPQQTWQGPRGLNGLSFIETPLNSRNQPILHDNDYGPASRSHKNNDMRTRSDVDSSPFFTRNTYDHSCQKPGDGQQSSYHALQHPHIPLSSHSHALPSQPNRLSFAKQSRVNAQPQWHNLQRAGVRSSRHGFTATMENVFRSPQSRLFSSAGHRSVRR